MSKRLILVACLVAFLVGWTAGRNSNRFDPRQERPVLAAIMRAAKTFLWLAAFAEPAPEDTASEHRSVMVDENGFVQLNHARGW